MEEKRLDVFLCSAGKAESRERAKMLITGGFVYVDGKISNKPSLKVSEENFIEVKSDIRYVGRGASKIEKAIETFSIPLNGKTAVDIGASTGGFTDYLLQHGAKKVFAVDVGHGQLHEKLKNDVRVINLEGINFRYADKDLFNEAIDIVAADVSFISLSLILPKIVEISQENTNIVVLIKPQFEAGRENIGKNGIVKDKSVHLRVIKSFQDCCNSNGLYIENITFSPIRGGSGNVEYLAFLKKGNINKFTTENYKSLIKEAFEIL
jgi:23S rRNA (cytidine1920-2'-O)/16S rRNA (cytidine1409-2'-O)-methyltransferase